MNESSFFGSGHMLTENLIEEKNEIDKLGKGEYQVKAEENLLLILSLTAPVDAKGYCHLGHRLSPSLHLPTPHPCQVTESEQFATHLLKAPVKPLQSSPTRHAR